MACVNPPPERNINEDTRDPAGPFVNGYSVMDVITLWRFSDLLLTNEGGVVVAVCHLLSFPLSAYLRLHRIVLTAIILLELIGVICANDSIGFSISNSNLTTTSSSSSIFLSKIKIITPWKNENFDEKNIRYNRDIKLNVKNNKNNNNNDDIEEVILATACSTIACGQMESQGKTKNSTLIPKSIKKKTTTISMIGDIEVPLNKLIVPQKIPDKIVHNPTITSIIQVEKNNRRQEKTNGLQKFDNILKTTSNVERFYSHQSKNLPLSPSDDVNHHDKPIPTPLNNEKLNETLFNINNTIINNLLINNNSSFGNVDENNFTSSTFDFTTSELDDILEITILGLFEMSQWGEARPEGPSELQAAKLAIERINEMGILSKFRLRLVHNDTRVSSTHSPLQPTPLATPKGVAL
ncbi:hypothetical protein PV326_007224 [Microctonus aethiopoides]|nr:hypothetical protein PV326_007224 [Microctonus aethiopoides]